LTIVTTHYPELKEWASATEGVANAATGFDPETDEPLYALALGRAGTSHALRIAERLGLDPAVVADARSRVSPERLRTAELLAEAEAAQQAAAETRAEVEASLARARARESELERELDRVRASAERERELAIERAERELADARAEIAALREETRRARRTQRAAPARDRHLGAAAERTRRADRAIRSLQEPKQVAPLAEGDPVEAPELGIRGTLARISGDQGEVVAVGGTRVRVPLARLRPSARREAEPAPIRVAATAPANASSHLDVRGMRAQEAREAVRRFVDDAALAGYDEVRVVHGRGTGAVRAAIREELARHPLAGTTESEANDGATVVYLGS
jgi:DNA mismatch repair protein MutS2